VKDRLICGLILTRPIATLQDFDQPLYITVAYDLDRYGTFSNGIYADAESDTDMDSTTRPTPLRIFDQAAASFTSARPAQQSDGRSRRISGSLAGHKDEQSGNKWIDNES
jgi:hypothetical protein